MEVIRQKTKLKISIDLLKEKKEEIMVQGGLLQGHFFDTEDLEKIKSGEGVVCYGKTPGFSLGFSIGFNS